LIVAVALPEIASGASVTRTSSFGYDAASGLLTQEVIEPNTTALKLQTNYTYNVFGQKTQVTVSGVDIATRSSSTTYDSKGQFASTASNALGHSESYQYDARFGLPTNHTGPNGLTTTSSYDSFGRKTLEVRADSTRTTWSYQYCSGIAGGTAVCPARATHLVTTTSLAADGVTQSAPTTTTYFDQLGRTVAADTQGFNGAVVRVETQYNVQGQIERKSKPYFVSGGTPKWTSYTYDALGRVLTQTNPDSTVESTAYHGLSVTTTNAQGKMTTVVKNSQANTVSVTDALTASTTYVYEPFGNLAKVTDAVGNITTYVYDTRGRKVTSNDPDIGTTISSYDVLDQLKTQTNAAGQVTTYTYDVLQRPTQRVEPDLTSTWTYDAGVKGVGKLSTAATTSIVKKKVVRIYNRSHTYDSLGRPSQTQLTIDGTVYTTTIGYDGASRASTVAYPSGFTIRYAYNATGYQSQISNAATSQVYWTANARDAEGHLTQQTAGNGVVTIQSYNTDTSRLTGITAGSAGAVASFGFTYDTLGRLTARSDANTSLSESFGYDALNRLTSSTVSLAPSPLVKSFTYDGIGRLTSKSDVGTYTYPAVGFARPHGVTSITGGNINTTFTYDPKGNTTAGNGLTLTYTSYNMPATISRGTTTLVFSHDSEHQRYKQEAPIGTTLYLGSGGAMAEKFTGSSGAVQWNNYLTVAGELVGMFVQKSDGTTATRYFHKDHLGSIAVITNETGAVPVLERLSYDAWGQRRFPNGADDPSASITSQTTHGFTEHEHLAAVGLVHMNGRVYDPLLARFGTPDPTTENPFSTQGWNRYSYVGNSPLNFTDPSGYCFLGCFWKPIFKAIGKFFRESWRAIAQIAIGVLCSPLGPICAGIAAAVVTGISGGNLGAVLRAGLIAGLTAFAFKAVGDITQHQPTFGTAIHAQNIAGHAAVGCLSAVASGGKCGPGALSGAAGSLGAPLVRASFGGDIVGGTVASSVLGGLGSVAGGGKFANGAVTAAFGYLFNEAMVQVQGNNVTIQIPITFQGVGATPDVITKFVDGIESTWTGPFGEYNVETRVVDGTQNIIQVPTAPGDGYAWVNTEGNRGSWPDDMAGRGAAHEAGHLMGLPDQYSGFPPKPNPGYEGNIMGDVFRGTPSANDIRNIINKKW
jgi:RHS repeat-associated protein